jgi:hypothetical protein
VTSGTESRVGEMLYVLFGEELRPESRQPIEGFKDLGAATNKTVFDTTIDMRNIIILEATSMTLHVCRL